MAPTERADTTSPWDFLRFGDTNQGLELIRKAYGANQDASHIMELGIAYLWLGDYESSRVHFENAITTYPWTMASFFGMAGAALWCEDQRAAAVDHWRGGLRAQYADAAGLGTKLPLLLFVASIVDPAVFSKKKAEGILAEKSLDLRAGHWPGVLTRFVLGQASLEEALGTIQEREIFGRNHALWWIHFYGYLLQFDSGILTRAELAQSMGKLVDTSQPLFAKRDDFLTFLWSEEFFIARQIAQSRELVT